jgi:hypothetical protein
MRIIWKEVRSDNGCMVSRVRMTVAQTYKFINHCRLSRNISARTYYAVGGIPACSVQQKLQFIANIWVSTAIRRLNPTGLYASQTY